MYRRVSAGLLSAVLFLVSFVPAIAGTTGGLRGRITDRETRGGVAGVRVAISSPSQAAVTTTDTNGTFVFLSLNPDTYTISLSAPGYDTFAQAGVNVGSDQVQTTSLVLVKTIKTIGRATSRTSNNIVKPGTTSDVYSVNAATQSAVAAVGGPGGLNQGYSALATVPGVSLPQGQQGWNQLVYVRGGDYEDVATELDGIPVQRASDAAPITTLSTLGQQELQVYTGGAPASADASGLSGYVNQVIRTGTYPGFKDVQLGVGSPAFYHKASFEIGGATQNRNFSYYLGFSGVNQDYRYGDQFNGAGNIGNFFAPLVVPTGKNGAVYDGSGPAYFSAGQNYSIANTNDRETVGNFHFALPHKRNDGKDDIQLLYVTSQIHADYYGSVNDLGGLQYVSNAAGFVPTYIDSQVYTGPLMTPLKGNEAVTPYYFPSSGTHTFGTTPLNADLREISDNGIGLVKLQYQKNINDRSYLRVFGYSDYSNWFINGPVSANLNYSGELADYEVLDHTFGLNARYENQLSSKHLLTVTGSYQTQKIQTYSNSANGGVITTNLVDPKGNCYSLTGGYASCFAAVYNSDGSVNAAGGLNQYGQYGLALKGYPSQSLIPGTAPSGSLATVNAANWVATDTGYNASVETVRPYFTAYSVTDQFRPNDKLVVNAGVRFENFLYRLEDPNTGPARNFWYQAYNRENCYAAGQPSTTPATLDAALGSWTCPQGTVHTNLVNSVPRTAQYSALQPRAGATYTVSPDAVLRFSFGRYAQQPGTSYQEFNTIQQNSPTYLSQFLPYGYNSPYHATTPSYSNSYDMSLEKHVHGTDYAFKLTPFYRVTQQELQSVPIGAQGVLDGINTGRGRSYGVELEFSKGDFSRQGLSYSLSYAFTNSKVRFGNFQTGNNFVDNLNAHVLQYNAFTSFCASNPKDARCVGLAGTPASTPTGVAAAACYVAGTPDPTCGPGSYDNPYWNAAPQPLFDRTGEYTPYDILPSPYQGGNGFVTPTVITGVLNYRRGKLALTPSATYTSGSFYGSSLTWPGYDPTTCTGATGTLTLQQSCTGSLFIPDTYTGQFDNQGAFREPTRLSANFQLAYDVARDVRLTLTMTGIIDHCYQRGYAWDNPATCVYAQLPSNKLAPVGNFLAGTNIPTPPQLRYPYSSWYNNSQTGYVGQRLPFNAFLNLEVRL